VRAFAASGRSTRSPHHLSRDRAEFAAHLVATLLTPIARRFAPKETLTLRACRVRHALGSLRLRGAIVAVPMTVR
jgi:hypothetical protein